MSALTLLLLALALELGFRALGPRLGVERQKLADFRHYLLDGGLRGFERRAHTIYQRPPSLRRMNSFGFNDRRWNVERTPGVPRIVCLGGSTTESGNSDGQGATYPRLLEHALEDRTGRDFEVFNAGISGWSTAEILVSWFLTLQDFAPDLVLIHEAGNDLPPRFYADFRADYSHWRVPVPGPTTGCLERFLASWSDLYLAVRLEASGVPDIGLLTSTRTTNWEPLVQEGRLPPETAQPFRRNVATIARDARSQGAQIALMTMPARMRADQANAAAWSYGFAEHNAILRELAAEEGFLLVDAALEFEERGPALDPQFLDAVHLTREGNALKAELIAAVLLERWVPWLSTAGARPPVRRDMAARAPGDGDG